MLYLMVGVAAILWTTYSVVTGKGYYKYCPPGGYDRETDPFNFWVPTIVIFLCGVAMVLLAAGAIR